MRTRSERGSAIAAGALSIAATAAGILSMVAGGSRLGGPGITGDLAANETGVVAVAFLLFIMAVTGYYLLYVSKRIPRWLSVWGLIAAPLMLIAVCSPVVTGDSTSTFSLALVAPMLFQEMVLAVWLIVRGFNPPVRHGLEVAQ